MDVVARVFRHLDRGCEIVDCAVLESRLEFGAEDFVVVLDRKGAGTHFVS